MERRYNELEDDDDDLIVQQPPTIIPTVPRRGRPRIKTDNSPIVKDGVVQPAKEPKVKPEREPEFVCVRIKPSKFNGSDTEQCIYEHARGAWSAGERATSAKHVIVAVSGKFCGELTTNKIIAVFDVEKWQKVDPSGYTTRDRSSFCKVLEDGTQTDILMEDRVEFIGTPTTNSEYQAMIGRIFKPSKKLNGSNPISYRLIDGFVNDLQDVPVEETTE